MGFAEKKEGDQLNVLFNTIPCLAVTQEDWLTTGKLLHHLRSKGLTIPLTDALIAVVAKRHNMSVLTLDKHFQHLPVTCLP